jgi:hypothetical protein
VEANHVWRSDFEAIAELRRSADVLGTERSGEHQHRDDGRK